VTNPPPGAIRSLQEAGPGPHAITIGNFDGVHRGHVHLFALVVDEGRRRGLRSLAITFEPHPTAVLRPEQPFQRLTTPEEKLWLMRACGIDDIAVIPFNREFAALEPAQFMLMLVDTVRPAAVYVGEGFRFGRGRSGDGETIRAFGSQHGFETTIIPRIRDDERIISSSSIRAALERGDIAEANHFLGRRYRLSGTVAHGAARGRELGYPTANLLLRSDACMPADGIYAAYAHIGGSPLAARQAMVYIGTRPTFEDAERLVEVNVLDFSGDLYTREIQVEFVGFVRGDAAFESADALTRQMMRDEQATRAMLATQIPEVDHDRIGAS
jgi:riboflavin kinase/FMN adenylyltransferase